MAGTFFFVLVRGRWAKAVSEQDFGEVVRLEGEGWRVVWDSARSADEGYAYAARFARCLQQDYADAHLPEPIMAPLVLYRSVSLPELVDVAARGSVCGRGNAFNEFDARRFVFFGSRITPSLLAQGEELERQAMAALSGDPVFLQFERLSARQRKAAEDFAAACEGAVAAGARPRDTVRFVDDLRRARQGSVYAAARLANGFFGAGALQREIHARMAKMAAAEEEMEGLRRRYKEMASNWMRRETEARANYPFTSAVLETAPLFHGFRYPADSGKSGMGDEDEFGFHRDSVLVTDLARVHCIRNGEIVRTVDASAILELAEEVQNFLERAHSTEEEHGAVLMPA